MIDKIDEIVYKRYKEDCMNKLTSELRDIFEQNKIGIFSLLILYILTSFIPSLWDTNINGYFVTFLFIMAILALSINEIIIAKNYIVKNIGENKKYEYNNFKTIFLQSLKISLKYLLLLALLLVIMFIIMAVAGVVLTFSAEDILTDSHNEALEKYNEFIFDLIFENTIFYIILGFLMYLLFFRLLFIVNILVFKQDNYKIKYIVKNSYNIIKCNRTFFLLSYFGVYFSLYIGGLVFENNYIFMIMNGILNVFIYLVYQIKFLEIIKKEYNIN